MYNELTTPMLTSSISQALQLVLENATDDIVLITGYFATFLTVVLAVIFMVTLFKTGFSFDKIKQNWETHVGQCIALVISIITLALYSSWIVFFQ